ncbi:MAG: flagellin lysine-N-methylase [Clostridium sp.]
MNIQEDKITKYDNFKCIADRCDFTCCEGWDIDIDEDTMDKWKGEGLNRLVDNSKTNEYGNYIINKSIYETCSKLTCKKLCSIVIEHGEEYLSKTCREFPRILKEVDGRVEKTLSCACPEVVDMIEMVNEITINCGNDLRIREALLNILKSKKGDLDKKLILCYEMLTNLNEDNNVDIIDYYSNKKVIEKSFKELSKVKLEKEESIEELNNLFLDIIENYKGVNGLSKRLEGISEVSEEIELCNFIKEWQVYKDMFNENDELLEKCMISKVYSNCISSNSEDVINEFQLIFIEYVLIRYAVFVNWYLSKDKVINKKDIRDYIVVFSRIVENNRDAMLEFIYDGFECDTLDLGYLSFITLF